MRKTEHPGERGMVGQLGQTRLGIAACTLCMRHDGSPTASRDLGRGPETAAVGHAEVGLGIGTGASLSRAHIQAATGSSEGIAAVSPTDSTSEWTSSSAGRARTRMAPGRSRRATVSPSICDWNSALAAPTNQWARASMSTLPSRLAPRCEMPSGTYYGAARVLGAYGISGGLGVGCPSPTTICWPSAPSGRPGRSLRCHPNRLRGRRWSRVCARRSCSRHRILPWIRAPPRHWAALTAPRGHRRARYLRTGSWA